MFGIAVKHRVGKHHVVANRVAMVIGVVGEIVNMFGSWNETHVVVTGNVK